MPTYQYACTNPEGKHEFEVVQSFTDAPLAECTVCAAPVRKVYGSVGVVFKGSGFYRTDSRKPATTAESSNGSSATKDSAPAASSSGSTSSGSASSGSASSGSASSSSASSSSGGSKAAAS